MTWSSWIRSLFAAPGGKRSKPARRAPLAVEQLEERTVLYSVTGNAWPNPQVITISFVPDGTPLSSAVGSPITSNLFSAFNAKFGSQAAWQTQVLKAAQVWAQQTNINFVVVPDSGASSGSGSYQQGDPGFGDLRIGGYVMGNSTLAVAYQPPPVNNYSIAGDITFNTGQTFNVGSTYDLFTVATHEFGHALGLDHSNAGTTSVMYPSYTGVKTALTSDDIAGIRNIYSGNAARSPDAYDALSPNNTLATASNITSAINPTALTALVSNLDITTTTDADYYTFTAPTGTSGTATVQVQSQGLSLLSPKVIVYSATGAVLGSASGLNQFGTTLDVTLTGVTAGAQYYVKVSGADTTPFSTGAYALGLNFGSGTTPVAATPSVSVANGNPISGGGGVADGAGAGDSYLNQVPVITGITPDNGTSSNDGITNTASITFTGSAPGGNLVELSLLGSTQQQYVGSALVNGQNQWTLKYAGPALAPGAYSFGAVAVDDVSGIESNLSAPFPVVIDPSVPAAPTVSVNDPTTGSPLVISPVTKPVVAGTAAPNAAISVYVDGKLVVPSGALFSAMSDSKGNWSLPLTTALSGGVHTVSATAMTVAGTTGPTSASYTFVVSSSTVNAPVITGIAAAGSTSFSSIVNSSPIQIAGVANAGATVTLFQSSGGSSPVQIGTVNADSTGHWLFDDSKTTLAAGSYNFSATETTSGGTSQASQAFAATIDLSAPGTPAITGLAPTSVPGGNQPPVAPPSQVLVGTAEALATVNVLLGGKQVGTTTADSHGNWSFDFSGLPLAQGSNSFTAQAVDAAGNQSAVSAPFAVAVSAAPGSPVVSGFSPAFSGSAAGLTSALSPGAVAASFTNAQAPTIFGTASAGSYVELFMNAAEVGWTLADSNGNWSYTSANLSDGAYNFRAIALAATGAFSQASNPLSLIVDTHAPSAPAFLGITPDTGVAGDNITSSKQISLFGTAGAYSTIDLFVAPSGTTQSTFIGSATADGSGNWTFNYAAALADGTYHFTAQACDLAGNVSQMSGSFTVVIDTTPPSAPVMAGIAKTVNGSGVATLVVSGTAEPQSQVQVRLNGGALGTVTADGHGNWTYSYTPSSLPNGTYTFTATATDIAGNVSTQGSYKLVLGNTALNAAVPKLASTSIIGTAPDGTPITTSTPTLTGTARPGYTVTIVDGDTVLGTAVVDSTGHWTFTCPTLAKGKHSISLRITDTLGDIGLLSSTLTLQV
jgi:hypothetical protein